MEKLYLEEPTLKRKNEAIDYINEHILYNSNINGAGSLDSYTSNYEKWLDYIELMKNEETTPNNYCPGYTYFLIREEDDKIVGMINIRYNLNEKLMQYGGHIGYGIRPTERRKGYNKINLYLGLEIAKKLNIEKVLLTIDIDNIGSIKTVEALAGVLENKINDNGKIICRYFINTEESLTKNKEYLKMIKR